MNPPPPTTPRKPRWPVPGLIFGALLAVVPAWLFLQSVEKVLANMDSGGIADPRRVVEKVAALATTAPFLLLLVALGSALVGLSIARLLSARRERGVGTPPFPSA